LSAGHHSSLLLTLFGALLPYKLYFLRLILRRPNKNISYTLPPLHLGHTVLRHGWVPIHLGGHVGFHVKATAFNIQVCSILEAGFHYYSAELVGLVEYVMTWCFLRHLFARSRCSR
jgi:hypothetical protein